MPGYHVDHQRRCEMHCPDAQTPEEAAQEYADTGDWNLAPGENLTLQLQVWSDSFDDHEVIEVAVTG